MKRSRKEREGVSSLGVLSSGLMACVTTSSASPDHGVSWFSGSLTGRRMYCLTDHGAKCGEVDVWDFGLTMGHKFW